MAVGAVHGFDKGGGRDPPGANDVPPTQPLQQHLHTQQWRNAFSVEPQKRPRERRNGSDAAVAVWRTEPASCRRPSLASRASSHRCRPWRQPAVASACCHWPWPLEMPPPDMLPSEWLPSEVGPPTGCARAPASPATRPARASRPFARLAARHAAAWGRTQSVRTECANRVCEQTRPRAG